MAFCDIPDILVSYEGTKFLLEPVSDRSKEWFKKHFRSDGKCLLDRSETKVVLDLVGEGFVFCAAPDNATAVREVS
jgi:hypothetical protein